MDTTRAAKGELRFLLCYEQAVNIDHSTEKCSPECSACKAILTQSFNLVSHFNLTSDSPISKRQPKFQLGGGDLADKNSAMLQGRSATFSPEGAEWDAAA